MIWGDDELVEEAFKLFVEKLSKKTGKSYNEILIKLELYTNFFKSLKIDDFSPFQKNAYFHQKLVNQYYLEEISKFNSRLQHENIQYIYMKGLVPAVELYSDFNLRRFHDIDVLIKEKDIIKVHDIMLSLGYCCKIDSPKIDTNHLVYSKLINGCNLQFEIHKNVCNPQTRYQELTNLAWDNMESCTCLDVNLNIMNPYCQFIHYILHFCEHTRSFYECKLVFQSVRVRMQILYDACLVLEKYKLDFDKLFFYTSKIGAEFDLYYSCKLIKKIVPDLIDNSFLEKLKSTKKRTQIFSENEKIKFEKLNLYELLTDKFTIKVGKVKDSFNLLETSQKIVDYINEFFKIQMFIYKQKYIYVKILLSSLNDEIILEKAKLVFHYYNKEFSKINNIPLQKVLLQYSTEHKNFIITKQYRHFIIDNFDTKTQKLNNSTYEIDVKLPPESIKGELYFSGNIIYEMDDRCITGGSWCDFDNMIRLMP